MVTGLAYDQGLADRLQRALGATRGAVPRRMFGGLAILYNGRMACGIVDDDLMVRVDRADYEDLIKLPGVRPMDFTGRPLRGFVFVGRKAIADDRSLRAWVARGLASAKSPRKPGPARHR